MKNRNQAIDILKGIGIILVLAAHSIEGWLSQFAYTFHMPLFFIVTGLFIKVYERNNETPFSDWWRSVVVKDFKRLLYPAFFTLAIILAVSSLSYIINDSYLRNPIRLIWNNNPEKPIGYITMLGNLWFLFALFFGKQFFYIVNKISQKYIAYIFIGIIAVVIGQWYSLPFEILTGISIIPFIYIGWYIRNNGGVSGKLKKWYYLTIPLWIIYIFFGGMRIGYMQFSWLYVFDIFAACGGTLFFYIISKQISEKTKYASKVLAFLGVNSLILICAPTIETYCFPLREILPDLPHKMVFVVTGKTLWCVLFIWLCYKIKMLTRVFGVKNV